MSGWDGDKAKFLTRQRDGNPVVGVRQYAPQVEWCCEACVFGRGAHSYWCDLSERVRPVLVNEWGQIRSDGTVFEAWRQYDQWHTRKIGSLFTCVADALEALMSEVGRESAGVNDAGVGVSADGLGGGALDVGGAEPDSAGGLNQ